MNRPKDNKKMSLNIKAFSNFSEQKEAKDSEYFYYKLKEIKPNGNSKYQEQRVKLTLLWYLKR